jgi:hypothetical protein
MSRCILFAFAVVLLPAQSLKLRHVTVFHEEGRFAGWPANHGAWVWGDEIVVGFEAGSFRVNPQGMHAIDYNQPAQHLLARSLDGGETWRLEKPDGLRPPPGVRVAGVPVEEGGLEPFDCPGGPDFLAPGFAATFRMASHHTGPSRFYFSSDRAKSWSGPYRLPDFGTPGVAARTSYLADGRHSLLAFLTAAKPNGREGRPFCARTTDGGKTWSFVSWIGPEPEGFSIMPSAVRLSENEILVALRRQEKGEAWIELWASTDNARTWQQRSEATASRTPQSGNPPSLLRLRDGRLCITYGHRAAPFGVRARLSPDGGKTWGREFILRDDGGGRDLGYPRTVQRADGALVTIYYFNRGENRERSIEATIWQAPTQ